MSRLRHRRLSAGEMWEAGYLPEGAACEALNCTPAELRRFVRDGAVKCRSLAKGLCLYQVPSKG